MIHQRTGVVLWSMTCDQCGDLLTDTDGISEFRSKMELENVAEHHGFIQGETDEWSCPDCRAPSPATA